MIRTRNRPLATGSISNIEALYFSGFMMLTASLIAIYLGIMAVLMLFIGAGSYLFLYSVLLKRKTSLNVFANAPSVAAPALFGWYLGGSPIFPVGFLMGFLVAIWSPLHLWSLAFAYSKDYSNVDIPMFPSVVSRSTAMDGILLALSFLIGSSYLLSLFARTSSYILGVTLINVPLIISGLNFYKKGSNKSGWIIFKITAPYIIIILSIFTLNLLGFI
jgi:protoheme IX farnesyltransferase